MADAPHTTDPATASGMSDFFTPAYLENRRRELAKNPEPWGMDELDPQGPSGHAYAIRKSTWLTSDFRQTYRKDAVDITPQQVIDVLNAAGVKSWVLIGLHGYVGYMPQPRATQDVDVMVRHNKRKRARKAIAAQWPQLQIREMEQVIRFLDPNDLDPSGRPKAVVDLMLPWSEFQQVILKEHVFVGEATGHRLPTLEAALVSKYAAMISLYRDREKKEYDAGDFRRLVRANYDRIDRPAVRRLADLIWKGADDEIDRFIELAPTDAPFPV